MWQVYASDEAKAKYKAAQVVGAGEQYILMLPMLDADKTEAFLRMNCMPQWIARALTQDSRLRFGMRMRAAGNG